MSESRRLAEQVHEHIDRHFDQHLTHLAGYSSSSRSAQMEPGSPKWQRCCLPN